ncbi:hypothetical protein HRI_004087900 [Hibiscus trionum]|uniref:DUF4283 domain-containing protein n=1 Tax=Hibiscus trionum TaxID=183268 RepID=A0A9W7J018_HIBTR|nr:hypothetical protein HRI_004087900 [Hibiscus trionum]
MANVSEDLVNLSIDVGEDDGLQFETIDTDSRPSFEHCFVGRFLTSSIINILAMKSTLANVWRPVGGIAISDIGDNRFLFRFFNVVDANRVDRGGLGISTIICLLCIAWGRRMILLWSRYSLFLIGFLSMTFHMDFFLRRWPVQLGTLLGIFWSMIRLLWLWDIGVSCEFRLGLTVVYP